MVHSSLDHVDPLYLISVGTHLALATNGAISSHLDIPDRPIMLAYIDGAPPFVAAMSALEAAGLK